MVEKKKRTPNISHAVSNACARYFTNASFILVSEKIFFVTLLRY
uniref:Orf120 n=1 Tax=Serratia marcescens TaxID=615 RepID=A0A7S6YLL3_SERMA|nr:Orf120 [Serratia marcescens]